jgi:molybdopterin-guanine dinucleotide biosynthesis protein MobB
MKRLHIIGKKNHGKTTLIVDLVEEFTARGLRVGTIKHTHHRHELDTPGKDSHRHRVAGAEVVGILAKTMSAVFWPNSSPGQPLRADRYEQFAPMFAHCDIVLVEGDIHADRPKIEVWRSALGTSPLAEEITGIVALVSDDTIDTALPVLPRGDVPGLADWIRDKLCDGSAL